MSAFTIEHKGHKATGNGGFYKVLHTDKHVFNLETWAFNCCGAISITALYNIPPKISVAELMLWLATQNLDGWKTEEIYFLLSCQQLNKENYPRIAELTALPEVKKVDCFVNKAHGPNKLHLFRYSVKKDFPK